MNRRRTLEGRTVLCGAGISFDPPSSLPLATTLSATLLDAVANSGPHLFNESALEAARVAVVRRTPEPLRLELVVDLLSRHIETHTLVRIYRLLHGAAPNMNHLRLVLARPDAILTTNQDTLLESAGRLLRVTSKPVHLHGRYDRPRSIITTISQYVRGLPEKRAMALRDVVTDRNVVVIGYSGRDRDVMPFLADANSVLWVQHTDSEPVSPERQLLADQMGRKLTPITEDTGDWLNSHVQRNDIARAEALAQQPVTLTGGHLELDDETLARFRAVGPRERTLAIGQLVEHLGDFAAADEAYRRLLRTPSTRGWDVELARANMERRLGTPAKANARYDRVAKQSPEPGIVARARIGQIDIRRNSSRFDDADALLDSVLKASEHLAPSERYQIRGRAYAHLGGNLRMNGDESGALEYYRLALHNFERVGSISGIIHVLTFRSDIFRSLGDYVAALDDLERTREDVALFADAYAAPWTAFYLGQTLCATGDMSGLDSLARARNLFAADRRSRNWNGIAWCRLMEANYTRSFDIDAAERHSDAAARAIRDYGRPMVYGRARLQWERAESARARGATRLAIRRLRQFRVYCATQMTSAPRYLKLHGDAIEAELLRDVGHSDAARMLRDTRRGYEELGAEACAARMEVAEVLASKMRPPPPKLQEKCARNRYGFETSWMMSNGNGYYPLHVT